MWLPSLAIGIISVLINLQELFINKYGVHYLGYLDEAFALSAYLIVPLCIRKKTDLWIYGILLAPILSTLHAVVVNIAVYSDTRLYEATIQSIINFKIFLYFSIFYCMWNQKKYNRKSFYITFLACAALSIIGYIGNIFSPSYFSFSESIWHLERNRITGFQFKPNDLAIFLCFLQVFTLFAIKDSKEKYFFVSAIIAMVIFTSSRTALIGCGLSLIFYFFGTKKISTLALLSTAGVILLLSFSSQLKESFFFAETIDNILQLSTINNTQYIRAIMVYYGIKLGIDFFPLGSGAGNFGGVMSLGSPVYSDLGLGNSQFFQDLSGIYDSNFAGIVGEYGLAGILIFTYFSHKITKSMFQDAPLKRNCTMALLLTTSLSQPIFSYQVNAINILLMIFSISHFANPINFPYVIRTSK